jgi:hypothetical protein
VERALTSEPRLVYDADVATAPDADSDPPVLRDGR